MGGKDTAASWAPGAPPPAQEGGSSAAVLEGMDAPQPSSFQRPGLPPLPGVLSPGTAKQTGRRKVKKPWSKHQAAFLPVQTLLSTEQVQSSLHTLALEIPIFQRRCPDFAGHLRSDSLSDHRRLRLDLPEQPRTDRELKCLHRRLYAELGGLHYKSSMFPSSRFNLAKNMNLSISKSLWHFWPPRPGHVDSSSSCSSCFRST